jgi:uncharacterized protein (TIGR02996 family)
MRTFELKGERFWTIRRQGKMVTVSYGKLGGKATSRTTESLNLPSAQARYQAQIAAKLKDGYIETTRDTPPILEATGQALEQAVVDDPADLAAHMAFADFLSEQSDERLQARGEFIRTQLALEDEKLPAAQRRKLKKRERELLEAHERDWLGWRLADVLLDGGDSGLTGAWKLDRVRSYARGWLDRLHLLDVGEVTCHALRESPSLRLLRHLTISDTSYEFDVFSELVRSPHLANIRVLELDEDVGAADQLDGFIARLPRIEELRLIAFDVDIGRLFRLSNLDNLRVLHVAEAMAYDLKGLANNAALGRLTSLRLEPTWAEFDDGPFITLAGVRALVRSKHLGSLTHLALHRTDAGDRGVREIVQSGILARLVELDLSHGCITDEGALALLAAPDYGHLRTLVIADNRLTEAGIAALERPGVKVEAGEQQEPDEDGEYPETYLYDDWDDFDEDFDFDEFDDDWE